MPTTQDDGWHEWCESADGQGHWEPYNYSLTLPEWTYTATTNATLTFSNNYTSTSNNLIYTGTRWEPLNYTISASTTTGGWYPLGTLAPADDLYENATPVYSMADIEQINAGASVAEMRAATQEAAAAVEAARQERARSRAVANDRAEELLIELLNDQQRESYRLNGHFEIIGSAGNVYRIKRGTSGNIEWIKPDGHVGARLCVHPTMHQGFLPTPDVMLAQMLGITTDERHYIGLANIHAGERPPLAGARR